MLTATASNRRFEILLGNFVLVHKSFAQRRIITQVASRKSGQQHISGLFRSLKVLLHVARKASSL
eukprot:6116038-Karenia_brevis.AAC.1